MDLSMELAAMALSMNSVVLQQSYSAAMRKTVMKDMEAAGAELLEMMPEELPAQQLAAQIPKGEFIDVFV